MKSTTEKYERYFERIFKIFEVEIVRFARMTQGITKQRERFYFKPTHEVKDLSKIVATIDYNEYGLKFSLFPDLSQIEYPACVLKCDYVLKTNLGPLVFPLDLVLDLQDFTPFVYQDILSEDLMLEVLEDLLALVRRNKDHFLILAHDTSSKDRLSQVLLTDYHKLIGPLEVLDENSIEEVMTRKRNDATSLWRNYFILGFIQESLDEVTQSKKDRSAYEERLINELKSLQKKGVKTSPVLVSEQMEKNMRYVLPEPFGKRKKQRRISHDVSYLLMLLPATVLVYFMMGFVFWVVTFNGYFSTDVKLSMGLIPVIIVALFLTSWGVSFAHHLVYPKDHPTYKGYDYRFRNQRKLRLFRAVMISGLIFMLTISSWIGSNVLIFYNNEFTLTPGVLWTSPAERYRYYDVDHIEYRYSLLDESGKSIKYQHYILVFKDGKKFQLKEYLTFMHCEKVLIPFLIRRNIKIIRYEPN